MIAEQFPKRYRIEYIEPGIVNYEDVNQGKVFVSREALDKMIPSYIGKPVVNEEHKNLTASEAFKLTDDEKAALADGVVYNCGWLDNGWCYCDVIIWNLDTQNNIDHKNYSASCAYMPSQVGGKGKWHGFEYDDEVLNGTYTHMAIVKSPRYEAAKITELPNEFENAKSDELITTYSNSIEGEKKMALFKLFVNKEKKEEIKNAEPEKSTEGNKEDKYNTEDTFLDIDGEKIPVKKAIEAYQAEIAADEEKKNIISDTDEIDVDGKKVKARELVDCFRRMNQKANAEAETKKEEEMKKEEVQKENSLKEKENFQKIENAFKKASHPFEIIYNTREDRLEEGKKRYGGNK